MADVLTKEQRSRNMANIKSKWTSIEKNVHSYLKGKKIPHKMHPDLSGSPDVILKRKKIAIFLHGCFWHKCPECYIEPKSRKEYWIPKINKNVFRDKLNSKALEKHGWKVKHLWEHQLKKNLGEAVSAIIK